jgi:hypothetical protein
MSAPYRRNSATVRETTSTTMKMATQKSEKMLLWQKHPINQSINQSIFREMNKRKAYNEF